MNQELKQHKATLRSFMRAQYSDDRLVMLLDHARSGQLAFDSCCCFIGLLTRDHDGFAGDAERRGPTVHSFTARFIAGAMAAEDAFCALGVRMPPREYIGRLMHDRLRRDRLIPMILAELKRRRALLPEVPEDGHELWLTHSQEGFYIHG